MAIKNGPVFFSIVNATHSPLNIQGVDLAFYPGKGLDLPVKIPLQGPLSIFLPINVTR